MRFADWDTGNTFYGEMIICPEDDSARVLKLFREGRGEGGFVVDPRHTGSIAVLEASVEDLLSLQNAGYRLSID